MDLVDLGTFTMFRVSRADRKQGERAHVSPSVNSDSGMLRFSGALIDRKIKGTYSVQLPTGVSGTSMIGNSQGKAEISLDLAE
jgi:hypothetical protein